MSSLFKKPILFAVAYCALLTLTYVLPWMGSNSAVVNALGATVGRGMTPQWWLHAWTLVMLVLLAWGRGDFIGKKHLPALSFIAAIFDMVPGLSMIPFVPTVFHLITLIGGIRAEKTETESEFRQSPVPRRTVFVASGMTVLAVLGSVTFISTAGSVARPSGNAMVSVESQRAEQNRPAAGTRAVAPEPTGAVASPQVKQPSLYEEGGGMATAPAKNTAQAQSASDLRKSTKRGSADASSSGAKQAAREGAPRIRYININE